MYSLLGSQQELCKYKLTYFLSNEDSRKFSFLLPTIAFPIDRYGIWEETFSCMKYSFYNTSYNFLCHLYLQVDQIPKPSILLKLFSFLPIMVNYFRRNQCYRTFILSGILIPALLRSSLAACFAIEMTSLSSTCRTL